MSGLRVELSQNRTNIYESKHLDGDIVKEHHHQIHQFIFTLDGEGRIMLDGKSFDLKRNRGALVVPFSNHSIVSDTKLTVLVLTFDQASLDVVLQNELLPLYFEKSILVGLHPFGENELRQLLRKILFEQSLGQSINLLAMNIYLSELLLVLARSQKSSAVPDLNTLRAEKLRNYIDAHYFEIVDSRDISSKLGVSIRHINNIFKEQYNITPMHYLTEVRIELAQKLLVQTDKEIASICFEIGFETLSSFYRTFKNYTQASPNTYRKIHRQDI